MSLAFNFTCKEHDRLSSHTVANKNRSILLQLEAPKLAALGITVGSDATRLVSSLISKPPLLIVEPHEPSVQTHVFIDSAAK